MSEIAVIGAGAWGTALSIVLGRQESHAVRLWAHEREVCESVTRRGVNQMFLPECLIPPSVTCSNSFEEVLHGAQIVVSAMPSHHTRRVFEAMRPDLRPEMLFVSAAKGIENDSLLRLTEVIAQLLGDGRGGFRPRIGALSGPTFAGEVAKGDPTAITIASDDSELAAIVQANFSDPRFRVYTNDDVIGVELGGALKNTIAIAAGVLAGLDLGHNTVAALVTRGLAEVTRLVVACGGKAETMSGLAGLGDLVLTCTGSLSRNRSLGFELGRGRKLDDVLAGMHGAVAEGVLTAKAAVGLAHRVGVEMPITEQMHAVLQHGKPVEEAIRELMGRPSTSEMRLVSGH